MGQGYSWTNNWPTLQHVLFICFVEETSSVRRYFYFLLGRRMIMPLKLVTFLSAHHGRWTNCLQLPFNCYMKMTNTASSNRQGLYSYKDLLSTVRHMRRMILLLVLKDNCTVTLEWVFGAVTVYFRIFFTHILIYVLHKVLNLYRA